MVYLFICPQATSDGGQTWGPLQHVASEKGHKIGNPAPVVLKGPKAKILLVFCRDNRQVKTTTLDLSDPTARWSPWRDISANTTEPGWRFVGSGPPGGIVLDSGRIVVGFSHTPAHLGPLAAGQGASMRSHQVLSDDDGNTWTKVLTDVDGKFSTSENQVANINNNILVSTARTQDWATLPTARNFRAVSVSRDAGQTWSKYTLTDVPDPTCEGSTLFHRGLLWMSSGYSRVPGARENVSLSVCDATCMTSGEFSRGWTPLLAIDR